MRARIIILKIIAGVMFLISGIYIADHFIACKTKQEKVIKVFTKKKGSWQGNDFNIITNRSHMVSEDPNVVKSLDSGQQITVSYLWLFKEPVSISYTDPKKDNKVFVFNVFHVRLGTFIGLPVILLFLVSWVATMLKREYDIIIFVSFCLMIAAVYYFLIFRR